MKMEIEIIIDWRNIYKHISFMIILKIILEF